MTKKIIIKEEKENIETNKQKNPSRDVEVEKN